MRRGIALLFSRTFGTRGGGGQPHTTAASTPRKDPVPIVQEARWAPGPVWMGGKSCPHQDSIPDGPACSSVAIPTELPGPLNYYVIIIQEQWILNLPLVGSWKSHVNSPIMALKWKKFSYRRTPCCVVYQNRMRKQYHHQNSTITKTVPSPKQYHHQNSTITKTVPSPKLLL